MNTSYIQYIHYATYSQTLGHNKFLFALEVNISFLLDLRRTNERLINNMDYITLTSFLHEYFQSVDI